jgi:regulator of replication initiation timing
VLIGMQAQVQAANRELQTITQHIQELTAENSRIRDEILKLQAQATKRSKAQTA